MNVDSGAYSFVAGDSNKVLSGYSSIAGGMNNVIDITNIGDTLFDTSFTPNFAGGSQFSLGGRSNGWYSFIGGGFGNHSHGSYSVIAGGWVNTAWCPGSGILAGVWNQSGGWVSFVGAGVSNIIGSGVTCNCGYASAIVAGGYNNIQGNYAFIGGGLSNRIQGCFAYNTIGGGRGNLVFNDYAFIGGGGYNIASGEYSTVGGGGHNTNGGQYGTIGGGFKNVAFGPKSTIGGGDTNSVWGGYGAIGGGHMNIVDYSADWGTIAGGDSNHVVDTGGAILGGEWNITSGAYASIGGGQHNSAYGQGAAIPGGGYNTASGSYSLAAGRSAQAVTSNSFVWNDNSAGAWASTSVNQFLIHAMGGVGIGIASPASQLHVYKDITISGEAATTVNFSNSAGSIGTQGVHIESAQLTSTGTQGGLIAKTAIAYGSTQAGSAEGRAGEVAGWNSYGSISGIVGIGDASFLTNYNSTMTSFGVGGKFIGKSTPGITLDATGTYYIGGVYGEVNSTIDASGDNAVVAGVIGVDKASGTSNHRAAFFDGVMRLKPMATAPASAMEGDVYVNGASHHIYCYLGGAWKQLDN